eukprot:1721387-Rhodomonas_salina.1
MALTESLNSSLLWLISCCSGHRTHDQHPHDACCCCQKTWQHGHDASAPWKDKSACSSRWCCCYRVGSGVGGVEVIARDPPDLHVQQRVRIRALEQQLLFLCSARSKNVKTMRCARSWV